MKIVTTRKTRNKVIYNVLRNGINGAKMIIQTVIDLD